MGGIILVLVVTCSVLAWKYHQQNQSSANQASATTNRIIKDVARLYMVPTNEQPSVAQIQDKSQIKNQEFFENAVNGDYLLVYQKNKLALLYRESVNKLVNVEPVSITASNNAQSSTH